MCVAGCSFSEVLLFYFHLCFPLKSRQLFTEFLSPIFLLLAIRLLRKLRKLEGLEGRRYLLEIFELIFFFLLLILACSQWCLSVEDRRNYSIDNFKLKIFRFHKRCYMKILAPSLSNFSEHFLGSLCNFEAFKVSVKVTKIFKFLDFSFQLSLLHWLLVIIIIVSFIVLRAMRRRITYKKDL